MTFLQAHLTHPRVFAFVLFLPRYQGHQIPLDITSLRIHAGLILTDPLLCCFRAVSCTWRGLASCLVNPLEAGDGGDTYQTDLATNPQYRTQLPSQRKRQGCRKSCGLGRVLPAGWSTHHQEVLLPIEENPVKSSICIEVPCPAPPFLVGLLGWAMPDYYSLGYLHPHPQHR